MGCNRVNGYICLGLILYLSTFPFGKAEVLDDKCTDEYAECGEGRAACCKGLTCLVVLPSIQCSWCLE